MNVVTPVFGRKAPADLSKNLRELADAVDAGEIECMVIAYIHNDEYRFQHAASYKDSVVLTALLQDLNLRRMRYEE